MTGWLKQSHRVDMEPKNPAPLCSMHKVTNVTLLRAKQKRRMDNTLICHSYWPKSPKLCNNICNKKCVANFNHDVSANLFRSALYHMQSSRVAVLTAAVTVAVLTDTALGLATTSITTKLKELMHVLCFID